MAGESVASLLQDFGRLFRGQTRHFTEHHDPIVNDLLQRVQLLPQGYPQELFKQLIAAAGAQVAALVGMNPGKQFPSAVDCRTINADGYRRLYLILLAYFVFQLMVINPAMQNIYLFSLALVCGPSKEQRGLLARLRRVQMLLPRRERKSPDMAKLSGEAWEALDQILRPGERAAADPKDFVAFMMPAATALNTALQRFRQQPNAGEPIAYLDPHVGEEIDRLAEHVRALFADFGIKDDPYTWRKKGG